MFHLDEELLKNISAVLEQAFSIGRFVAEREKLDSIDLSKISFSCTEVALNAFSASFRMEDATEIGDRLLQEEIAFCLNQIALHCVDIQTWTDEANVRYHIKQIQTHCTSVANMLDMSEPITCEKSSMVFPTARANFDTEIHFFVDQQSAEIFNQLTVLPQTKDKIEQLKIEIKALRELLSVLVLERDNLLLVESKELEARYMNKLGRLELEVYQAESDARYLQRKLEMMQAAINRQEEINVAQIEEQLDEQYQAYKKVFDEYVRKAKEAAASARKRQDRVNKAQNRESGECSNAFLKERNIGQDKGASRTESSNDAKTEDPAQRLKRLYRKIVKAMHPDVNPNQDEREKELFKKAVIAYEEGDIHTLEEIASMLDDDSKPSGDDLLQALLSERNRLLSLIQGIREQINRIRSQYPFTKKEIVENPILLQAEKEKLTTRLERARHRIMVYQKRIDEVIRSNGRTNHKT